jgi:hypothetical protein
MNYEQFKEIRDELRNIRAAAGGDSVTALMILAVWYYWPTIMSWLPLSAAH